MANRFVRFAFPGGDIGNWDLFEEQINQLSLGNCTAYLYDDAGTLKLGKGRIGLDDGSQKGAVIIDTVTTLSIAALTPSEWARVEISRTASSLHIDLTSIAGASDPSAIPSSFTGAYDGNKQGYYLTSSKRLFALVWINAGGTLEGIVNCGNGLEYAGYSQSDDAYDRPYVFLYKKTDIELPDPYTQFMPQSAAFTAEIGFRDEIHAVTTGGSSFNGTIPAAASWKGKRKIVKKIDSGAGVCTVVPAAGTLGVTGATAFPLRKQGDYIILESDGTNIYVIASLSTLDSPTLDTAAYQTIAHGCGVKPRTEIVIGLCISTELGFAADDEGQFAEFEASGTFYRWTYNKDGTNYYTNAETTLRIARKDTGAYAAITMANWKFRLRYSI